jgi:type III restriction enzyme
MTKNLNIEYHEAKQAGKLAELPTELAPYKEQVFALIDSDPST